MSKRICERVAWNKGLSAKTDPRVAKNIEASRQTLQTKYGVTNISQIPEVADKLADIRNSDEWQQKVKETKKQRYDDPNYNNMEKNHQTKLSKYDDENYNNQEQFKKTSLDKYGTEHPNQSQLQRDKIAQSRINNHSLEKAKQTIIAKYGDMKSYYDLVACKRYETMRKNGTLGNHETQPEREYYAQLCLLYGEDNIIKQYYDKERYPFKCDFYIIPEDKFVEINAFFTHGPHPFDKNNPEDLRLLLRLEDEQTEWSKMIIYVWTDLDVRKLETAKKNKLNFEAIYWYNR